MHEDEMQISRLSCDLSLFFIVILVVVVVVTATGARCELFTYFPFGTAVSGSYARRIVFECLEYSENVCCTGYPLGGDLN